MEVNGYLHAIFLYWMENFPNDFWNNQGLGSHFQEIDKFRVSKNHEK